MKLTQEELIRKMKIEFAFNGIKMEIDGRKVTISGHNLHSYDYTAELIYSLYKAAIADAEQFLNEDFEDDPIGYMCSVVYPQKEKI